MVFEIGLFIENISNDNAAALQTNLEAISSEDKIPEVFYNLLEYAATEDKEKTFKLMLNWVYSNKFRVDNIFVNIASTKNLKYLKLMLENRNFNVNHRNGDWGTALCVAANDPACLKVLLAEKDIDLNQYGRNLHDLPLFVAIKSKSEECINLLINDDRLHEDKFGSEPTLLIAAQNLDTYPLWWEKGLPKKDDQWVYEQAINRLLYESKNTLAQFRLNYLFEGRSILHAACQNGNLKLFKYFLYANGWGTKVYDEFPGYISLDFGKGKKPDPNNADNWEKSNELFLNFLDMNDALRSSLVGSDLLSQNRITIPSKFPSEKISANNMKMIFDIIMQFYVRDTDPDNFIRILASTKIDEFVVSTEEKKLMPLLKKEKIFMVELLKKIRTYYGIDLPI